MIMRLSLAGNVNAVSVDGRRKGRARSRLITLEISSLFARFVGCRKSHQWLIRSGTVVIKSEQKGQACQVFNGVSSRSLKVQNEVLAALINAGGSVLSAFIGVVGVYAIFKHRNKVQRLSQEVEAYYHFEGELIREIYRLQNAGVEVSESSLPALRGQLRNRLAKDERRPSMTAREASDLRDRLL